VAGNKREEQTMKPTRLYHGHKLNPAYHLRYTWAGWLSLESQNPFPAESIEQILDQVKPLWEQDGLRLLEPTCSEDKILLTFSTKPTVSPLFLAARAKGRLQHAFRLAGKPCKFSRKVGVRSVGNNRIQDVEKYIAEQVEKSSYIDPAFRKKLESFIFQDESVDLCQPTATNSGRYWYDLHIVLVVDGRYKFTDERSLATIRDWSLKIAEKKKYGLSCLSVMPDHLHLALRADIEQSPQDVVLVFQNNLAYAMGRNRIWSDNYYVGTFGVYNMNAVRRKSGRSLPHKAAGVRCR
jgi:REP element-mobilizing transposase RayT